MPPNLNRNSYEYVPDIKRAHEETSLLKTNRHSQECVQHNRRKKCAVWKSVAFLLLAGSILEGIWMVVFNSSSSLKPEFQAAQARVHIDPEGKYHVDSPDNITENTSFAELAKLMLPPWYEATLMAVESILDPKRTILSNVANAQEVLLITQNLLDTFGPVFAKGSVWKPLHKLIKRGCECVGHYEDLTHSSLNYSQQLLYNRKRDILEWKRKFQRFHRKHHVRDFLSHHSDPNECARHKSSTLFWGGLQFVPCGHDVAAASLQHLGHIQLSNAAIYWDVAQDYASVLGQEEESECYNLGKELRVFLREYDLFENIVWPQIEKETLSTLEDAQAMLGDLSDQWTSYTMHSTQGIYAEGSLEWAGQINSTWTDFKGWAQEKNLTGAIKSVLYMLE